MNVRRKLYALVSLVAALGFYASAGVAHADDYPRQPDIDVLHYEFRLELSDTTDTIHGLATITVKFTKPNVNQFQLDLTSLQWIDPPQARRGGGGRGRRGAAANGATSAALGRAGRGTGRGRGAEGANAAAAPTPAGTPLPPLLRGMTVDSVKSGAMPLAFKHFENHLTIRMPTILPKANETWSYSVKYHGIPATGLRIANNKYNERGFFSTNWPDLARQWLPTVDHPSDKATSEFYITAPRKYQVVANGLLIDEKPVSDSLKQTHWKQSVPIATWLNAIGVQEFATHQAGKVRGIELSTWVDPQDAAAGPIYFEEPAKKAIEFYSDAVGPYPYEKLANVACPGLGGGTEHASAIFYGDNITARPATNLVAHEIAHQWFGDSVTESSWDDVWLSEGFATYFTLLYAEHYEGRAAFVGGLKSSRMGVLRAEAQLPNDGVIHQGMVGTRGVLNQLVYQKGGWFLHMLRAQIGTDNFWKGIKDYYKTYRDKNAKTEDLRAVMEKASGQDLKWLFDQWLRRPGSPKISGTWNVGNDGKMGLDLTQTQASDAFRLPMEVAVLKNDGTTDTLKIDMKTKTQHFDLEAGGGKKFAAADVKDVVLDPGTWVLMEATLTKKD